MELIDSMATIGIDMRLTYYRQGGIARSGQVGCSPSLEKQRTRNYRTQTTSGF